MTQTPSGKVCECFQKVGEFLIFQTPDITQPFDSVKIDFLISRNIFNFNCS